MPSGSSSAKTNLSRSRILLRSRHVPCCYHGGARGGVVWCAARDACTVSGCAAAFCWLGSWPCRRCQRRRRPRRRLHQPARAASRRKPFGTSRFQHLRHVDATPVRVQGLLCRRNEIHDECVGTRCLCTWFLSRAHTEASWRCFVCVCVPVACSRRIQRHWTVHRGAATLTRAHLAPFAPVRP